MFFVPNFMVSLTVITSISGGIFFQEFINFDIVQFIFYPVGLLSTVVGVFILSQRDAAKKAEQLDVPMNVVVGAMSPRRRRKSSNARARSKSWPPPSPPTNEDENDETNVSDAELDAQIVLEMMEIQNPMVNNNDNNNNEGDETTSRAYANTG